MIAAVINADRRSREISMKVSVSAISESIMAVCPSRWATIGAAHRGTGARWESILRNRQSDVANGRSVYCEPEMVLNTIRVDLPQEELSNTDLCVDPEENHPLPEADVLRWNHACFTGGRLPGKQDIAYSGRASRIALQPGLAIDT